VLDLKNLIYIDTSGADVLVALAHSCAKKHVRLILCGLAHQPKDILQRCGLLNLIASTDLAEDLAHGLALATDR
jgi:SulP family sulfate permease